MQDINRFGDSVGRAAEAMQLAYLTTVDRSLGVIRVFPVPLMQRVYEILSKQFGWPQVIDASAEGDDARRGQVETLKAHERVEKHLRSVLAVTEDQNVQRSTNVVLEWIGTDCQRIRQELGTLGAGQGETAMAAATVAATPAATSRL